MLPIARAALFCTGNNIAVVLLHLGCAPKQRQRGDPGLLPDGRSAAYKPQEVRLNLTQFGSIPYRLHLQILVKSNLSGIFPPKGKLTARTTEVTLWQISASSRVA